MTRGNKEFKGYHGQDGIDGYTPIRGKDYWTEEDKQEIFLESSALIKNLESKIKSDKTEYDSDVITGENIHITDAKQDYMSIIPLANTVQDTEPSIDNPSEIKSVKGSYGVEVVNKNLIDNEWESGNINETTGKIYDSSSRIRTKNFIPIIPNVEMYISRNLATGYTSYRFYDKNKEYLGTQTTTGMAETNLSGAGNMQPNVYNQTLKILNPKVAYMKIVESTMDLDIKYLLQVGTTNTDYIEHQSQILNLDFPEGIELNKLGDISDNIEFNYTEDELGYKTIDRDSVKHIGNINTPTTITPITDEIFISQLEALLNAEAYFGVTNIFTNSTDGLEKAPLNLSVEYLKSNKIKFESQIGDFAKVLDIVNGEVI